MNDHTYPEVQLVCGETRTNLGRPAGMTIADVKRMLAVTMPQLKLPANAVAVVATMDPGADAWLAVRSEEADVLIQHSAGQTAQLYQAVAKIVPDTYQLRCADIYLLFADPAKADDQPKKP